jgi:hypothetical protein
LIADPFRIFSDMMKEQDKFNGLSKGQVKQIIRRNMITRVKSSKKVYDRKKFRKRFGILRKGSYIHGIEIKVMINLENVKKAVELQKEANAQIDLFGRANNVVVDEMLELVDNFNSFEENMFVELMSK